MGRCSRRTPCQRGSGMLSSVQTQYGVNGLLLVGPQQTVRDARVNGTDLTCRVRARTGNLCSGNHPAFYHGGKASAQVYARSGAVSATRPWRCAQRNRALEVLDCLCAHLGVRSSLGISPVLLRGADSSPVCAELISSRKVKAGLQPGRPRPCAARIWRSAVATNLATGELGSSGAGGAVERGGIVHRDPG